MTDQERYLFDIQGFLTIPDALSPELLRLLNAILDERIAAEMKPDETTHRFGNLLSWGAPFRHLIDNARVLPYLESICGEQVRLDHVYCDVIRPPSNGDAVRGPIGTTLHGGGTPWDFGQYYAVRAGRIRCGLVVAAYNLADVAPNDGGFGCVPGSHKAEFPFPNEWRELATAPEFVRRVTGPAGTAVVFTEALTHGTLPWRGAGERRTVFFKYNPHCIAWNARPWDVPSIPDLTERQTAMLEAPNARYQGRKGPDGPLGD
jgi:hypothetical protein